MHILGGVTEHFSQRFDPIEAFFRYCQLTKPLSCPCDILGSVIKKIAVKEALAAPKLVQPTADLLLPNSNVVATFIIKWF